MRLTSPMSAAEPCYHCGEDIPGGVALQVEIAGEARSMCCPGCQAVAALIAGSGMENFYRQRTAYANRPAADSAEAPSDYAIYDDPAFCEGFTEDTGDGQRSARLLLGGMTCAACTWLIEQSLSREPGVSSAVVNLQQNRLDLCYDPDTVALSTLFQRVESLGYTARPFHSSAHREQMATQYRSDLRRLAVAGIGMMQVGMFAVALHAGDIQGIAAQYESLLRWVSLLVASFVVVFSARSFFSSAWRHLRQGALVMDLPVSLAIGLAWLASVWATISGGGQVYFDSVVMFTFFLLLGRFLEQRVRQRHSLTWFDAEATLPDAVPRQENGQWCSVPRAQLHKGDHILLRQGETVAVDARVRRGESAVKEDTFNGEHLPRSVSAGDIVYAGTVNVEAPLEAEVLGSFLDTRLAALQRSVDQAQTEKPRLAKLADRIAGWFVAGVLLVTSVTAAVWYQIEPSQALWVSLSVLVISCPCALALATPAALTGAASALRSSGVIVRGENALEALARVGHLIFDKTGTLTRGQLSIARVVTFAPYEREEALALAAALQHYSNHPVAQAFAGLPAASDMTDVDYIVGAGLEGRHRGRRYRIGSGHFCTAMVPGLASPPDRELYWIALCDEKQPIAWIGLQDSPRPEAAEVIADAGANGLQVELLTGDRSDQGPALAQQLGISEVRRGQMPQDKMQRVRELQQQGDLVAMVGDGLNDAPVLGLADASFAVAGATDLARTQADFVIADGDLRQVMRTWRKARLCHRIMVQNLCWALGYNLSAIPLAAAGFVPPWAAAIGMSASSLLVVLNSLRLNRDR